MRLAAADAALKLPAIPAMLVKGWENCLVYHISVDQILHGETMEGKSTERMQFETLLDELTDAEIKILTATAQALLDARTDNEGEN